MKVLSFIMAMFLPIAACFGQEFLYSPDYIYGCASDYNESRADSLSLLSFCKCVNVAVLNSKEYVLNEGKNGIVEEYKNTVSIISKINVNGEIRKHLAYDNGIFIVYYYLNKKKYFNDCMSSYNKNIELAESYKGSKEPHAKNFVLGYYYLAFESVSDELFVTLFPHMNTLRNGVLNDIIEYYNCFGYLLSARNVGVSNSSGVLLIRDENSKTLPGFEYKKDNGKWDIPRSFCDINGEECLYENAKWAYVYTHGKEFRFLFEVKSTYSRFKIDVPDEFYSAYLKRKNFYF